MLNESEQKQEARTEQPSGRQLELPLDRGDSFRLLPQAQADWAMEWFQIFVHAGVMWNGRWKEIFGGRELRVNGREFYIREKDDVFQLLSASHRVPVRTIYRYRQDLMDYLAYWDDCRRRGIALDVAVIAQILPARAQFPVTPEPSPPRGRGENTGFRRGQGENNSVSFQRRSDAGKSKSIPARAQEWLLARYSQGSRPGHDGQRPTMIQTHYDYEIFRAAMIEADAALKQGALRDPNIPDPQDLIQRLSNDGTVQIIIIGLRQCAGNFL